MGDTNKVSREWKKTELGKICSFGDGAHSKVKRVENGVPYLTSKNVKKGFLTTKNVDYISKGDYLKLFGRTSKSVKHLETGDVLMGIIGTFGNCYVYKEEDEFGISSSVGIARPNKELLDSNYLYYHLSSNIFMKYVEKVKGGSVQGYTNLPTLRKLPIYLPTLQEQEKISSILKSLDDKIEVNNQMNKTLEEMAQAIFKEWFVEFNFPNEDGVPYKDNGGEMIESELGMIPEGWRVEELRNLLRFIKGKKPKNISEGRINENQQQYLTIKSYTGADQLFADIDKIILTEPKDSVMVMDGASSGTIFYGKKGIVASTIARIDSKKLDDNFIYYLLKSYESEIKQHLTGSAIPHTDKEFIYRIQIALPLKNFNFEIFSNIRNKIIEVKEENETLIKTRDNLLPKLMSGEVRV